MPARALARDTEVLSPEDKLHLPEPEVEIKVLVNAGRKTSSSDTGYPVRP